MTRIIPEAAPPAAPGQDTRDACETALWLVHTYLDLLHAILVHKTAGRPTTPRTDPAGAAADAEAALKLPELREQLLTAIRGRFVDYRARSKQLRELLFDSRQQSVLNKIQRNGPIAKWGEFKGQCYTDIAFYFSAAVLKTLDDKQTLSDFLRWDTDDLIDLIILLEIEQDAANDLVFSSIPKSDVIVLNANQKSVGEIQPAGSPIPENFGGMVGNEYREWGPVIGTKQLIGASLHPDWADVADQTLLNKFHSSVKNRTIFVRETGSANQFEAYYLSKRMATTAEERAQKCVESKAIQVSPSQSKPIQARLSKGKPK